MPRTFQQFQQLKDERKKSIIEAALPLFAIDQKKVSVDAISEKAKCSHGLVYHYFNDVDAVFNEIINSETYEEFVLELKIFHKDKYAIESINEIMTDLYEFIIKKNRIFISLVLIAFNEENKKSFTKNLIELVKRGQKEGDVTGGEPEEIAELIKFLFKGFYLEILTQKHPNIKLPSLDYFLQTIKKKSAFRRAD